MTLLILWVLELGIAYYVGERKGRVGRAVLLALFLGPFGLIIAMFMKTEAEREAKWRERHPWAQ
jgi:hypothetical protein